MGRRAMRAAGLMMSTNGNGIENGSQNGDDETTTNGGQRTEAEAQRTSQLEGTAAVTSAAAAAAAEADDSLQFAADFSEDEVGSSPGYRNQLNPPSDGLGGLDVTSVHSSGENGRDKND